MSLGVVDIGLEGPCVVCRELTPYVDLALECPLCPGDCYRQMWLETVRAWLTEPR